MVYHRRNRRRLYRGYAQVMDNFSKTCAAIILLLSLAAGAVALDARAEDYTPDEAAQEEQEQAPSIDTSSYVQVADPALYAKLDTLQESIDRMPKPTPKHRPRNSPRLTIRPSFRASLPSWPIWPNRPPPKPPRMPTRSKSLLKNTRPARLWRLSA